MAYIGRDPSYGLFESQILLGNGVDTSYTLDYAVSSAGSVIISRIFDDGVNPVLRDLLVPNVDYFVANKNITFIYPTLPSVNDTFVITYLGRQMVVPVANTQQIEIKTFTGNGVLTTFDLVTAVPNPASLMVFVDGIFQKNGVGKNYVTSGSNIVFSVAPDNNAEIEAIILAAEKIGITTQVDISDVGRTFLQATTAAGQRASLGIGSLGTQESNNVNISGGNISGITDLAVADGGTGASNAADARTNLGLAIGTNVQAYDANTAKINAAQSWSGVQKANPLTDNDLTFDLAASNVFYCTPTAGGTLTFTNIAGSGGQSGTIILNNTANYSIAKAATTKTDDTFLTLVSATGTYRLSYFSNGINVYVSTTKALS